MGISPWRRGGDQAERAVAVVKAQTIGVISQFIGGSPPGLAAVITSFFSWSVHLSLERVEGTLSREREGEARTGISAGGVDHGGARAPFVARSSRAAMKAMHAGAESRGPSTSVPFWQVRQRILGRGGDVDSSGLTVGGGDSMSWSLRSVWR